MSKLFWLFVKWRIKKGYGGCKKEDREDGYVLVKKGACVSCKAGEVMDFIDNHMKLL
jgi:hypothetical protein